MLTRYFNKHKNIIIYSISLAIFLFLLRWLEYRFVLVSHAYEIYITFIAILFTGLGIWLALKLMKAKVETRIETIVETKVETVIVEKEVFVNNAPGTVDEKVQTCITEFGLSNREIEVLHLMAKGFSNQEIADKLFVSLSTIKTHTSRLFEKLDVKRRTQAIDKAKQFNII